MAPHRNQVEARSSRVPVRQFVSETHDHKPDAPVSASKVKETLAMSRDEILLGRNAFRTKFHRHEDAVTSLVDAFVDSRFAEIKDASEKLKLVAADLRITAGQIEYLAQGIVNGCVHQLNRRPR
jgi:hypothetical protein